MPRVKDRERVCKHCEKTFTMSGQSPQWRYCSVECRKLWHSSNFKSSERAKRDPRQQKNYWLKTKYGITIDTFEEMLKSQWEQCAICLTPIGWSAHVDHCHETGKVRGLLCSQCNQALGLVKENPKILESMIDYIKRNKG